MDKDTKQELTEHEREMFYRFCILFQVRTGETNMEFRYIKCPTKEQLLCYEGLIHYIKSIKQDIQNVLVLYEARRTFAQAFKDQPYLANVQLLFRDGRQSGSDFLCHWTLEDDDIEPLEAIPGWYGVMP